MDIEIAVHAMEYAEQIDEMILFSATVISVLWSRRYSDAASVSL
jgi:hypothetical protein